MVKEEENRSPLTSPFPPFPPLPYLLHHEDKTPGIKDFDSLILHFPLQKHTRQTLRHTVYGSLVDSTPN